MTPTVSRYADDHPSQFLERWGYPEPADGTVGTAVLLHGGFWRAAYGLDLLHPLAGDLVARGWSVANVEYRRVGDGGGWPATGDDVTAAFAHLRDLGVDLGRAVAIGHSAGGHLALRSAAGEDARPAAAVSLAGVADLVGAARAGLGGGAAQAFLGGEPGEVADRYADASPLARLPLGVPQLLVHGDRDDRVPVDQSRRYTDAARAAGDPVELLALPGVDHFQVVDPADPAWHATAERLPGLLAAPPARG